MLGTKFLKKGAGSFINKEPDLTHQVPGVVRLVEGEELVSEVPVGRVADLQGLAGPGAEAAEGMGGIGGGALDLLLGRIIICSFLYLYFSYLSLFSGINLKLYGFTKSQPVSGQDS